MHTRASLVARISSTNPQLADAVLAVGLAAAAAVAGEQYHPEGWPRFDALAYALSALISLPLAFRRRAPVLVLTACCLAFAGYLAAGYSPSLNFWAPAIALYSVAAHRPPRTAAAGAALTAAVIFYSGLAAPVIGVPLAALQAVGVPAVVWLVGNGTRCLADRNRQLAAMTEQLRRAQKEQARQAATEERVRIARELHDVVAHHLSVISVQAGLADYVFTIDPPTARGALGTIAATSREALEELRRMLALLRVDSEGSEDGTDDGRSFTPAPDLGRLGELAERVGAAGVPVRLRTEGVVRRLPAGVGLCAYRVVQEALTNVLKYARPCRATVLVSYGGDVLVIIVRDDGSRPVPAIRTGSGGHGLIGMRERARILGGTVTAGPRPRGGFEVELILPIPTAGEDSGGSGPV